MRYRKTFTIIEVLVVAIIIAILATIGIVNHQIAYKNVVLKEGRSAVELISSAEKIYKFEQAGFSTCANLDDCNTKLNTRLTTGNWDYSVSTTGTTNVNVNATYTGNRSDITECYRTVYDNGDLSAITCN